MCLHGTPGIHDGVVGLFDRWLDHGFGVIAPTRPGYGRTPLVQTYADQADVFAALLDSLGVDKVVAYGMSGGGPAAIQFAARHPNRTHALLTECAVTGKLKHHGVEMTKSNAMKFVATSTFAQRMAAYVSREALAKQMLGEESTYSPEEIQEAVTEILNDPIRMRYFPKLYAMN